MSPTWATFVFTIFAISSLSSQQTSSSNLNEGFGISLIHRDSPRAPSYNPNATLSDRWKSAYQRSIARGNFIQYRQSPSSYSSKNLDGKVSRADGDYFMRMLIGTPPQKTTLLVDTGSELIWTQCTPCTRCYEQNDPLFDPSKSKTFGKFGCHSIACQKLTTTNCSDDDMCKYTEHYADNSETDGILSADTFTFTAINGIPVSFPQMAFGCGYDTDGLFSRVGGGILGLSGDMSLIAQLGIQVGGRMFSHCFIPHWSTSPLDSHLYLGSSAFFLGNATRLSVLKGADGITLYFLNLEDISVGTERLGIPPGTFARTANGSGGVIIDSGTPYTNLNTVAFDMVVKKLREMITLEPDLVKQETDPGVMCYKGNKEHLIGTRYIPMITFHFWNVDLPVRPLNLFDRESEDVICLAMVPTKDVSVIGNYAMQNINIGFDLDNEKLTMAPADCRIA